MTEEIRVLMITIACLFALSPVRDERPRVKRQRRHMAVAKTHGRRGGEGGRQTSLHYLSRTSRRALSLTCFHHPRATMHDDDRSPGLLQGILSYLSASNVTGGSNEQRQRGPAILQVRLAEQDKGDGHQLRPVCSETVR